MTKNDYKEQRGRAHSGSSRSGRRGYVQDAPVVGSRSTMRSTSSALRGYPAEYELDCH